MINLIIKMFKSKIVGEILGKVVGKVNDKAKELLNQQIKDKYPVQFNTPYDVSLQSAVTNNPNIVDNGMIVSVDGTFFQTSQGYHRISEPNEIKINNDDQHLIDLYISEFTANSLLTSIYGKEFKFENKFFEFYFKSSTMHPSITFENGVIEVKNFMFNFSSRILIVFSSLDASLNGKFKIKKFDAKKRTIELQIIDLEFDEFDIHSDFHFLHEYSNIIRLMIQIIARSIDKKEIKVPALNLPLDIDFYDIDFDMHDNQMKIGVDFNVNQLAMNLFGMYK